MSEPTSVERSSTIADFELQANGTAYDVSQVAGGFIILSRAAQIPPCEADLFITVEGDRRRRHIRLPRGETLDSDWAAIERLPDPGTADAAASVRSARGE